MKSEKLNKSLVLYVFNPPTNYTCKECAFISPQGNCSNYIESDKNVKPYGSCNDWRTQKHGYVQGTHDRTKEQTGYTENEKGFGCRRCEEFIADTKMCKKVDESGGPTVGIIHPGACCSRWEADPVRSKMSDNQLNGMRNYRV